MPAAAERVKLVPTSLRRAWRKERKFSLSESAETTLQPMPWVPGYSQLEDACQPRAYALENNRRTHSKSRPSRLYWETRLITVFTNAVLFASVATAVENHCEPVQPPMVNSALTP